MYRMSENFRVKNFRVLNFCAKKFSYFTVPGVQIRIIGVRIIEDPLYWVTIPKALMVCSGYIIRNSWRIHNSSRNEEVFSLILSVVVRQFMLVVLYLTCLWLQWAGGFLPYQKLGYLSVSNGWSFKSGLTKFTLFETGTPLSCLF